MKKISFYEVFEEEKEALQKALPEEIDARFFKETLQEASAKDLCAPIVSIRTQSIIPDEWVGRLKGVLTRSTGYDHVLKYVAQGVPCGYLSSYCSRAVAEQAMLTMMALWRKLPRQMKQLKNFSRDGLSGREAFGKNILVVGVGRIGMECVKVSRAFGMNVKGVDIDPREKDVDYVQLKEGLAWADAVVCAVPLTRQTRNMFSKSALATIKKGALFINISRGEASPLDDIYQALEKGQLGGAGMDVYDNEPDIAVALRNGKSTKEIKIIRKMIERHNVILTPHNAFNTDESVERKGKQSADSIMHFFEKGTFLNEVPKTFTQEIQ